MRQIGCRQHLCYTTYNISVSVIMGAVWQSATTAFFLCRSQRPALVVSDPQDQIFIVPLHRGLDTGRQADNDHCSKRT